MRRKVFAVLITFILLNSIHGFGEPVLLKPAESRVFWVKGHPFARKEKSGVTVLVSYSKHEGSQLVFDIEVINGSRRTVVVNPGEFYFTWEDEKKDSYIKWALPPERKMGEIDGRAAREERKFAGKVSAYRKKQKSYHNRQAVNAGIGCLFLGLDTASAVSGKRSRKSYKDAQDVYDGIDRDNERIETRKYRLESRMFREEAAHEKRVKEIEKEKAELKERLLFKSSVEPGKRISGEVYFEYVWEVKDMKLFVNFNDGELTFAFKKNSVN